MTVFVDTSGLYAVLDRSDRNHREAGAIWEELLAPGSEGDLVTSSFVVVETWALVQARLGMDAARVLVDDVLPAIEVVWVDGAVFQAAASAVLAADRRGLTLVDCVSFEVMRRRQIRAALAFDRHFEERGHSRP